MGGWAEDSLLNDVWLSRDGRSWTQLETEHIWTPRWWFASTVMSGDLFVLGGDSQAYPAMSDVWVLSD